MDKNAVHQLIDRLAAAAHVAVDEAPDDARAATEPPAPTPTQTIEAPAEPAAALPVFATAERKTSY